MEHMADLNVLSVVGNIKSGTLARYPMDGIHSEYD